MDFIVYLNFFMLGWVACRAYMAWKLRQALKKVAEDNGMSLEELAETFLATKGVDTTVIKVPNMFTELTKDSILLYNKDTGNFVGQAKTLDELANNLYNFDKINFANVTHEEKNIWFVEGKVKDNLKDLQ